MSSSFITFYVYFVYKKCALYCNNLRAGTPQLAVARPFSLLRAEWFSATAPNSASHFVCRQNAPAVSQKRGNSARAVRAASRTS